MSAQPLLLKNLVELWPIDQWSHTSIVLAVSGGADSVALLRALHSLTIDPGLLHVAHFNHAWRGTESDDDERFVVDLCKRLGLNLSVGRNTYSEGTPRSEEFAREQRYVFLSEVARSRSATFIATAHTASDRIETMLHNLCRGTGLSGVCTPTLFRQLACGTTLVRPMIQTFREDTIEYLSSLAQPFRNDSSNQNESYRRNFLRHSILPLLRQVYGDSVDERLLAYSNLAEQTLQAQREWSQRYWSESAMLESTMIKKGLLSKHTSREIRWPCAAHQQAPWAVVQLALQQELKARGWKQRSLTRRHWTQLRRYWEKLAIPAKMRPRSPRSLFHLPDGIQVYSLQGWLILSKAANETNRSSTLQS